MKKNKVKKQSFGNAELDTAINAEIDSVVKSIDKNSGGNIIQNAHKDVRDSSIQAISISTSTDTINANDDGQIVLPGLPTDSDMRKQKIIDLGEDIESGCMALIDESSSEDTISRLQLLLGFIEALEWLKKYNGFGNIRAFRHDGKTYSKIRLVASQTSLNDREWIKINKVFVEEIKKK